MKLPTTRMFPLLLMLALALLTFWLEQTVREEQGVHPSLRRHDADYFAEKMLVTRYGVDYVRLVRAEGAIIDAPVQRGGEVPTEAAPDGIEILSGLEPGDRIVPPGHDA